jgi:energy-coupling factor transporter transmembrane protein EcfT
LIFWRVFFQPLVVRLIRSADELAMAAELKGLEPNSPFDEKPASFSADDGLVFFISLMAIVLAMAAEFLLRPGS